MKDCQCRCTLTLWKIENYEEKGKNIRCCRKEGLWPAQCLGTEKQNNSFSGGLAFFVAVSGRSGRVADFDAESSGQYGNMSVDAGDCGSSDAAGSYGAGESPPVESTAFLYLADHFCHIWMAALD